MVRDAVAPIDPRKVAIYIRWSTDDQGTGTTLDVQRDSCIHYAHSQQWTVPDHLTFIDDGYSGADLDRPAMTRLRAMVQKREVQCIIVNTIDRLSRNIVDAVTLVLQEWDEICHVKCVKQPLDTTSDVGRMIFGVLAGFADFERSQIRARTFSGKMRRAAEGKNAGRRIPYGYRRGAQAGDLVIEPTEAAVVQRIFTFYAEGRGPRSIADTLNREGVSGPTGMWNRTAIDYLIQNPTYVGTLRYGVMRRNSRHKKDPAEPFYLKRDSLLSETEAPGLAVIDRELWERVQVRKASVGQAVAKAGTRGVNSRHLLTGLVRCKCGHNMQGWTDTKGGRFYRCNGRQEKGETHCDCGLIPQVAIDNMVVDAAMTLQEPAVFGAVLQQVAGAQQSQITSHEAQVQRCKRDLAKLEQELTNLRAQRRSGEITMDEYREFKADADRDIAATGTELAQAESALSRAQTQAGEQADLQATINSLRAWDALPVPQRKEILRTVFTSITAYRKARSGDPVDVEIHGRWGGVLPSTIAAAYMEPED